MGCHKERTNDELMVCNTLFKYKLNEVGPETYELIVTPCNTPTAVYCCSRITKRENCCNNMEYYQAFINSEEVVIIQDCDLERCICKCIENYFNHMPRIACNNNNCTWF